MQEYYKRIEMNTYLPRLLFSGTHGFDGWLSTSILPLDVLLNNPQFLGSCRFPPVFHAHSRTFTDLQLTTVVTTTLLPGLPIVDPESPLADGASGIMLPSFTIDANHNRSTVRDRLVDVRDDTPSGRLNFATNTLATRILMCNSSSTTTPLAYGVEIASGAALPVANNFRGKQELTARVVTARHEVVVSAGVFQSPQLV